MKKIIILVLVLILATLCFASCLQTDEYAKLNEISKKTYSQVKIDITVQKTGEQSKLVSNIVCININDDMQQIAYVLQEYAQIDINGDTLTMPTNQIVTKTGTVVLEGGKVSEHTGDQVEMDFSNVADLNMTFEDAYLSNAKTENGVFTADIFTLVGFWGRDVKGATNIKVAVNVETYKSITISYTANGSDVTIVYTLA
ncbi:MAG: hypothetical protein J6Q55_03835 [Clostridia bacterium]|nr:hypothetical protein [Clostridia bacterium]